MAALPPASEDPATSPGTGSPDPSELDSSAFAALSNKSYRTLFVSATIVVFGVMGQAVARGWLALELSGSNAGLGGVMLAFGGAMLVTTPIGGVTADRCDKRTILFVSVSFLMVTALLLGVAAVTETVEYWMLVVASAMQAAAFAFYLPARIAFISEVVGPDLLRNAVVLAQISQETARVLAPALAGLLVGVAWFGVGGVFLGSGVAIAIAALMLTRLPKVAPPAARTTSPFGDLVDAASFVRGNPDVLIVGLLTIGVVMIGFPYLTFLPSLADYRISDGATGYGIMSGVAGLGAFCAGMIDAFRNRGMRPRRLVVASGLTLGAMLVALGLSPNYVTALISLFVIGGSALVFQTSTQ
ncbi:MAG: MFS transporter, partial [Actinomycetota bacterium]|nr:MFS transporter [Actinomycetota bacterium]